MTTRSSDRSAALLNVDALECRRGERTLFSGLGFALEPGRMVWLRGANGQGKTTLLRTLAGLSAPEAGTIAWREPDPRRRFLYIAHANALKEELSVAESLRFLVGLSAGTPSVPTLTAALARFGLASRRDAPVRTLSQGQRRRVALARLALPHAASTWLLDEPFDALDAGGVEILNALLAEHSHGGGGIVLSSHVPLTIADPLPTAISLEATVAA